ncbi:MAG: Flp pilus assembly protein CpaB [Alphaproteobacteria bacterium]
MNIARVGLLVVAVGAAGAAAFLVRSVTHKPAHEMAHQQIKVPPAQVLVAAHAIDPGSQIKAGDLRWQEWPGDSLSPSFVTDRSNPAALSDTLGETARAHVEMGEPITSAKLVKAGSAGYMAAMMSPGMRAISTKIDEESAAGGFILPGDRVDVLLTHKFQGNSGGGDGGFDSETILRDVKVLAIGQTVDEANGQKTVTGRTATLETSPAEAERLALSAAMGNLTLILRSAANGSVTAATKPESDGTGKAKGSIRVVRYAHATRVVPAVTTASGDQQ